MEAPIRPREPDMSAKVALLCALSAAVLIGAGFAAFVLTGGAVARPVSPNVAQSVDTCAPSVKAAPLAQPAMPEIVPVPKPDADPVLDDQANARLRARIESALSKLAETQSQICEATEQLADDSDIVRRRKRPAAPEAHPPVDADRLAEIVLAQKKLLSDARQTCNDMKSAKLSDLAADMEQVQRLLEAIVGALTQRTPDIGWLTLGMQQGVLEKLNVMLADLKAARPNVEVHEVPAAVEGQVGPLVVATGSAAKASGDRSVTDLRVEEGATLSLGKGTLSVSGDFANAGTLESAGASLVMNGGNQTISGNAAFYRARFSGGTKRLTSGSKLTTTYNENSNKKNPVLVIEAGCTLIVENDSELNVPNAYGLRVEGTLLIDGGTVNCSFTHGHGVEGMNATWVKGSQLIIRSGSFLASGDSSFDNASVYLQGGEIRVDDDIWGSGDLLEVSGGVISNASGGGQFYFTGQVRMSGGRIEINQYEGRGFVVGKDCDFWCTAGEIVLGGQDVSGESSGIVLARNVQLPTLKLNVNTRISKSTPEGTVLSASGGINIAKDKKFNAQGRQVIANIESGENFGTFEP